MKELYKQWCKETKRNGAILVHGSINEFFDWLELNNSVFTLNDMKELFTFTCYQAQNKTMAEFDRFINNLKNK